MIEQTYTSAPVAVHPQVALSHLLSDTHKRQLKVFTVKQDGEVWRWRVSYPHIDKCSQDSTMAFATRAEAERVMQIVADCERPSVCFLGAFQDVPADAGLPAEYRDDWVGV